jgi:hypothetical protein
LNIMSQKQEILIAESISDSKGMRVRCENFGNQSCHCGYCNIDG